MAPRLPLSEAGLRLGCTYQQVRTLVLKGELRGGRDEFGRFFADMADVERLAEERRAVSGQVSGVAG